MFFQVEGAKHVADWNGAMRVKKAMLQPPQTSRAQGRSLAVKYLRDARIPYVINWDSIAVDQHRALMMGDPFHSYVEETKRFLQELGSGSAN